MCHLLQINAKIADYGIARFTTMQGLQAQEGTPGYRAPEVIRKENYSFQVIHFSSWCYLLQTGTYIIKESLLTDKMMRELVLFDVSIFCRVYMRDINVYRR